MSNLPKPHIKCRWFCCTKYSTGMIWLYDDIKLKICKYIHMSNMLFTICSWNVATKMCMYIKTSKMPYIRGCGSIDKIFSKNSKIFLLFIFYVFFCTDKCRSSITSTELTIIYSTCAFFTIIRHLTFLTWTHSHKSLAFSKDKKNVDSMFCSSNFLCALIAEVEIFCTEKIHSSITLV